MENREVRACQNLKLLVFRIGQTRTMLRQCNNLLYEAFNPKEKTNAH